MSRFRYEYWDIDIPGDLADSEDAIVDQAIYEARENAKTYRIPADWAGRVIRGEIGDFNMTVRVRRRSFK